MYLMQYPADRTKPTFANGEAYYFSFWKGSHFICTMTVQNLPRLLCRNLSASFIIDSGRVLTRGKLGHNLDSLLEWTLTIKKTNRLHFRSTALTCQENWLPVYLIALLLLRMAASEQSNRVESGLMLTADKIGISLQIFKLHSPYLYGW